MSVPTDPFNVPPQPKSGMSTGGKVFLGLGIGCGLVLLLCCGVFGFFGYFMARSFQPSEDPETVRRVAQSIATVEVPATLEPKIAIDFSMPFVDRKVMSLAVFADKPNHSSLVLFEVASDIGDPRSMKTEFESSLSESGHEQSFKELPVTDAEEFQTEINGQAATFEVGKALHDEDKREVWQATGAFTGKGGAAMLILQLDAAEFSKEDALAILKSLK